MKNQYILKAILNMDININEAILLRDIDSLDITPDNTEATQKIINITPEPKQLTEYNDRSKKRQ